ncbi:MAG: ABC transporter ATP-binding protein [Tumebacillaceae bacterium]
MEKQPIVQIRNLTKRIGRKTIVDNLSFDVPPGEVFGFLGPNGAGKTTTIRMIMGLISMNAGQVVINGHDVTRDFERAMMSVGAIVENPEMYKFLSGYRNLVHYARMYPNVPMSRIDEVVRLVGLENRIHNKVKTYSLGMRQRLGLAQALLHKPSVLILDEPTNGLDPAGIRELRDHLRMLAEQEGIAVIVSSHLLTEMELMCDRVAIINHGKLVDVRQLRDLVQTEQELVEVLFQVASLSEAQQVVQAAFSSLTTREIEGTLAVRMTQEQIPDVNAALVQAGVRVYGIRAVSMTLEDKFLQMTGGGQIV